MTEDHLIYEKDGAIATMTFNRPKVHNALSREMSQAMTEALKDFEADDELIVLIVTGAGDKAFCSGADLKSTIPAVTSMAATATRCSISGSDGRPRPRRGPVAVDTRRVCHPGRPP